MVRISPPGLDSAALEGRAPAKRQRTAALPSASDLWVGSLPGLDDTRTSLFAGNLPATLPSTVPLSRDSDAHLYFLLARNKHIPNRQRLVIWLNGGPGCSSFDGALVEIGPLRINPNGTVRVVENTAWNEYANVLFLDQPAGTGYSYVTKNDNVRELADAADQVVAFLANLYQIFPEFATMDTYIAGESYAGQYIPYIADAIHRTTAVSTHLKGLLIGNGWISPREQYPAYLTYVLERGLLKKDSQGHRNVAEAVARCQKKIAEMDEKGLGSKGLVLVGECEEILGVMSAATMKDGLCLNSYDTSQYHACGTEWPPDLVQVTKYLREPDVIKALHGEGARRPWSQCDSTVGSHFWTPNSVPSIMLFPQLLERMPILLYAGDRDLICAGVGIEAAIEELEWDGLKGFNGSEALDWTVAGEPAGRWTTRGNLTYVDVYNSSHMVPMDQPVAAHDMLLRFMQVDTLRAAGAAAKVPSRVGTEAETVLGATHPNGTTLPGVEDAVVADASADAAAGKDVTEDGFDVDHERYYGPRRTAALVFFLLVVGGAGWMIVRWRTNRRRERHRRLKGKGRAIRLEDREAGASSRSAGYRDRLPQVEPVPTEMPETVAVFDVGEEDSLDEEEDEDGWGDLGRAGEWADEEGALEGSRGAKAS
ncbi:hypothetical protein JCM5296_002604 [Sporobolomyces johnsonii]